MMNPDRLFEPLRLTDKCELPNRLVMAPMTTTAGNADGSFSDQEIAYLARRARGGIGTIITPACYCHKSGHAFQAQVGADSDALLPSLQQCADAVREAGGKSFLQLHHGGNAARKEFTGQPPLAPSAVRNRRGTSELPDALTVEQIHEIIAAFASAARRARQAGFDGIELHGANTYLLQQFFSPFTNKRDDQYGVQSRDNQCRFAAEVVAAVRAAVGPDYPVLYRVSPEEEEPDGYRTDDVVELLRRIVPLGIDAVHVSSWEYGKGLYPLASPDRHPTRIIRESLPVPVIGVGTIKTPEQALRVIDDGVDMVALGRVLLFDADWGVKAKAGRSDEIKQSVNSQAEIDSLEVPDKMKTYLRKFYPDNL